MELYNSEWINTNGNFIHKTAIVYDWVELGTGNTIGAYCIIGGNGEIRGVNQEDFKGKVKIGNNNVISELVTIQRPFDEGKYTIVGDNNIIMRGAHSGHDSVIGNNCEICCNVILGGYATVGDNSKIKLGVIIRNRLSVGANCIVGMGGMVVKNVPEGQVWMGNPARFYKLNNKWS